ncbi:MAG: TolC family protein [Bacteroides sp.]|nr:TolC family protein [Bacteroides sp.]
MEAGAQKIIVVKANPQRNIVESTDNPAKAENVLRLTLEECLTYAFDKNYNRESMKLTEEARGDSYHQSKKERLPDLSASIGETFGYNKTDETFIDGNYQLNSDLVVYQGGNITQTIRKNKLMSEQAGYQTKQYDNDLTIQILQAFLTALGNEELLKYQQALLKTSEEQVKQGRHRYSVGEILESDFLLLEAQYATDKNNIVETTINRDNNLLALKSLLSIDPLQPLEIIYPDADVADKMSKLPAEDYVLERSLATLPDMQISRYSVEIAETGLRISKSGYYPTVSLNGNVSSGHLNDLSDYGNQLSDRFNAQIGVSVSMPLFNRGRTKSNVTQSRIALEQAQLDQKQTELNVRQNILQEYRNVVSAESKYEASKVKEKAYSSSFEAYRAKYDTGSITTVELLQQQNNYISAMNDFIQNKYGFMLKRKILDVYMGERITM